MSQSAKFPVFGWGLINSHRPRTTPRLPKGSLSPSTGDAGLPQQDLAWLSLNSPGEPDGIDGALCHLALIACDWERCAPLDRFM